MTVTTNNLSATNNIYIYIYLNQCSFNYDIIFRSSIYSIICLFTLYVEPFLYLTRSIIVHMQNSMININRTKHINMYMFCLVIHTCESKTFHTFGDQRKLEK